MLISLLNRNGVSGVALGLFLLSTGIGYRLTAWTGNRVPFVVGLLAGLYLLFSIKIANPWEKVAVLRLGLYAGLRGPGIFQVIPVIDHPEPVCRVRVANMTAESTLTRDTVPVDVDAIVFWLVWNAEKSILEVEDFVQAIMMSAQTGLRESIGRHELSQMVTERESMGRELQRILDEKTNPWGITVQSVEIRGVRIPQALEDAMLRQAQAERECQALHHSWTSRNRDLRQVFTSCSCVSEQPGGASPACHEYAVRSHQRARVDCDRTLFRRRDDGIGWFARNGLARQRKGPVILICEQPRPDRRAASLPRRGQSLRGFSGR